MRGPPTAGSSPPAARPNAAAVPACSAAFFCGVLKCSGMKCVAAASSRAQGPILIGDDAYLPMCGGCFEERAVGASRRA